MAHQPLLMPGEKLLYQNKANLSDGGVFREGEFYLTNRHLIWNKISALKAGVKAGLNLVVGVISAAGESNYSIALSAIVAVGEFRKTGVEFLTCDGKTYRLVLVPPGFSSKITRINRDKLINYIQKFIYRQY